MARRGNGSSESGFTLIELLVVIMILGILAAISIPIFYQQREKGWDAAVTADLRNAATAQETFITANDPSPYATTVAGLAEVGFRPSKPTNYFGSVFSMSVSAEASYSYCLTARSASGTYLGLSSGGGLVSSATALDPDSCA
jgi:type IV pilus assembly protein PilA